jgi:hypothetical protein
MTPASVAERLRALADSHSFADRERGDYWMQGLRDRLRAIAEECEGLAADCDDSARRRDLEGNGGQAAAWRNVAARLAPPKEPGV